jgi:hypothetical protein
VAEPADGREHAQVFRPDRLAGGRVQAVDAGRAERAYTRSPSVAGDSDAYPLDPKVPTAGFRSATLVVHTVLPVAASRQATDQR